MSEPASTTYFAIRVPAPDFERNLERSRRRLILAGAAVILVGFGGLGGWAALAPLASAVLASGVVKVASERKTIQHLEGGIVRDILVREDQTVQAGQVLMKLDDTNAKVRHALLEGQADAARAELARLEAERDDRPKITFPASLEARRSDQRVARLLAGEEQVFASRRQALQSQVDILKQRIQQYGEQAAGLRAQVEATDIKYGYLVEELTAAESLLEKGIYTKPRYLALKRAAADLESDRGRLRAAISENRERVGEANMRIVDQKQDFLKDVNDRLQAARLRLNDAEERLAAAADILARTEIKAPQAGRVLGLKAHTVGGVINPGAAILDIVPSNDRLIIEASVRPEDIDEVRSNMSAEVRFTSFSWRATPALPGKVTRVSADRFVDPARGSAFYTAQVEVDPRGSGISLQPGMPAEVYIVTGSRTTFDYLFKPIREQIRRGMLEE